MKNDLYSPLLRMAVISLVLCGLVFPIVVTGLGQALMPYQANGELVQYKGRYAGSIFVAENFTSPMFFHSDNESASASGVDPDITLQDAYSQIPRISNATGIPATAIKQIVDANIERTLWVAGDPYVNVLRLNIILTQDYPSIYSSFI